MSLSAPVTHSRQPSFLANLLHEVPTPDKIKAEHNISLVDHTKPPSDPPSRREETDDAERNDSSAPATPATEEPLLKRLTHTSTLQQGIRQQIAKQKYARYGRDRYGAADDDGTTQASSSALPDDEAGHLPQPGEEQESIPPNTSYLARGRAKASTLLKRKRTLRLSQSHQDSELDILYENQRGLFLFGLPRYSSASLLPSDPRPWQNAAFRTSPVDIRNAQVPDPSWEWVWKNWYVDMSRDVDEEGWEYSVLFNPKFNWHGNHPWFHSFVRRRRWLRLRRRKGTGNGEKGEEPHAMTAEYFSIHPKTLRPASGDMSKARSSEQARKHARMEDETEFDALEIEDIASLLLALRKASLDRERLLAVRKFVTNGRRDELVYLSQHMPELMAVFIYQSSRRQLLAELIAHDQAAHERRESLKDHDHADADDAKKQEHEDAVKHAEDLHKAVIAAEEQVKRLEYWSDIKGIADEDEALHNFQWKDVAGGAKESGHPRDSFASKQKAEEGAHELHAHPEGHGPDHTIVREESSKEDGKGGRSREPSTPFFDAAQTVNPPPPTEEYKGHLSKSPPADHSSEEDRYTTAAESADDASFRSPAQKGREKAAKLSSLDGFVEEGEEPEAEANGRREDGEEGATIRETAEAVGGGGGGEAEGDGEEAAELNVPMAWEGEEDMAIMDPTPTPGEERA